MMQGFFSNLNESQPLILQNCKHYLELDLKFPPRLWWGKPNCFLSSKEGLWVKEDKMLKWQAVRTVGGLTLTPASSHTKQQDQWMHHFQVLRFSVCVST